MISEVSAQHGREGMMEYSISYHVGQEAEKMLVLNRLSLVFPFYSIWVPSLWDGAAPIQVGFSYTSLEMLSDTPRGVLYQSPRCFSIQSSCKSRLTITLGAGGSYL
jgi:hypothetical protein